MDSAGRAGQRTLGVCYYPEHWPEELWAQDAARMAEAGLTWVRTVSYTHLTLPTKRIV